MNMLDYEGENDPDFDPQKADRNKDGKISDWERSVGNAVAKSMREQKEKKSAETFDAEEDFMVRERIMSVIQNANKSLLMDVMRDLGGSDGPFGASDSREDLLNEIESNMMNSNRETLDKIDKWLYEAWGKSQSGLGGYESPYDSYPHIFEAEDDYILLEDYEGEGVIICSNDKEKVRTFLRNSFMGLRLNVYEPHELYGMGLDLEILEREGAEHPTIQDQLLNWFDSQTFAKQISWGGFRDESKVLKSGGFYTQGDAYIEPLTDFFDNFQAEEFESEFSKGDMLNLRKYIDYPLDWINENFIPKNMKKSRKLDHRMRGQIPTKRSPDDFRQGIRTKTPLWFKAIQGAIIAVAVGVISFKGISEAEEPEEPEREKEE